MKLDLSDIKLLVPFIDNRIAKARRAEASNLDKGKVLVGGNVNQHVIERFTALPPAPEEKR
ncbi:MAG: hypothetical protein ABSF61_13585 [Anaerolineales bacterium]